MYRNIYFNIRGDYEWGIGHSSQEAAETFRAEINSLFSDAGWQINRRDHSCGICDIVTVQPLFQLFCRKKRYFP